MNSIQPVKVAFIDDYVDINYIRSLYNDNIYEAYQVNEYSKSSDCISHGTICVKIFIDNVRTPCQLYFYQILDQKTKQAEIGKLICALNWCRQNDIKLINLSLGTTNFYDAAPLHSCICELVKQGIIIVAAYANYNKMTFPASFDEVIGVKYSQFFIEGNGFIYISDALDNIDIHCCINNQTFNAVSGNGFCLNIPQYNENNEVAKANSYMAPIITAVINNYIYNGVTELDKIRALLLEESCDIEYEYNSMLKEIYCKDNIEIPVIAILIENIRIRDIYQFIISILTNFKNDGYFGISVSDGIFQTDYSNHFINIRGFEQLGIQNAVKFVNSYIRPDFIMMPVLINKLNAAYSDYSIDILIYAETCDIYYVNKICAEVKLPVIDFNIDNSIKTFKKIQSILS